MSWSKRKLPAKGKHKFIYYQLSIPEIVSFFQNKGYKFNQRLFHSWVAKGLLPRTGSGQFFADVIDRLKRIFTEKGKGFTLREIYNELKEDYPIWVHRAISMYVKDVEAVATLPKDDIDTLEIGYADYDFEKDSPMVRPADFEDWIFHRYGLATSQQIRYLYLSNALNFLGRESHAGSMCADSLEQIYHEIRGQVSAASEAAVKCAFEAQTRRINAYPSVYINFMDFKRQFIAGQAKKCFGIRKEIGAKLGELNTYVQEALILTDKTFPDDVAMDMMASIRELQRNSSLK